MTRAVLTMTKMFKAFHGCGKHPRMSTKNPPPPDQQTAHESVRYEADVGRFSRGIEEQPATPQKLHRGRFSEGMEELP